MEERAAALGLIAAPLRDTGYIQSVRAADGTGARYTMVPVVNSKNG
ncbi:MAG: hypothetical protein ACLPYB_02490 [Desulfobaccales bacterium]